MEFIDLKAQQQLIGTSLHKRINQVLTHGQYIMGPEISELESALAEYVGVKHCISVSSGTDALLLALMALGIKAGDEVITPAFSYFATAEVIALLGAKPVFLDIEPETYNLNPKLIEAAISEKTKAIMPVSLYGQCADFKAINEIATKYQIPVIEDGAQSFGAHQHGQASCGLSDIGCTSFFPSKPLGCYGDGGACFTNNDGLAQALRELRSHGQTRRYEHTRLGINGRMDTIQAAILLAKLDVFAEEVSKREQLGAYYTQQLPDDLMPPHLAAGNTSVYGQYTIRVENRDAFREALSQQQIPTAVHYPKLVPCQPALKKHYGELRFAVAEKLVQQVVSLPMHPYLTEKDIDHVVEHVVDAVN